MTEIKGSPAGPKWRQIANSLRNEIASSKLAPGDKLPTETELVNQWKVARATARQALQALAGEGLIISQAPHGWFVRGRQPMTYRPQDEAKPPSTVPETDHFLRDRKQQGRQPKQIIEIAIEEPDAKTQELMQLPEGELVVIRRRVRYLDGEPFNINDSYFPLSLAQNTEIMSPADIYRGANTVLAEHGHIQVRAHDEYHIRMPTPEETRRLQIPKGTPVAHHIAVSYTQDNKPVRMVNNVLPGDRHVIIYERSLKNNEPQP